METKYTILIFLMIFICRAEIPEKALSLEDVMVMSKNSVEYQKLKIQELEYDKFDTELFYYYFPKINMNASVNHNKYAYSDSTSNNTAMGLNLTQNLLFNSQLTASLDGYNLFEEKYKIEKSIDVSLSTNLHYKMKLMQEYDRYGRENEITKMELEESVKDFYLNIIQKFYSLYRVISQFEIETKGYELSLKHYNEGVAKYKAGIIPEVEMLDLELYLQKNELSLKRSKNSLTYTKEDFNRYFKLPNDYEIRVKYQAEDVNEYNINVDSDQEQMILTNPELLIYKYNIVNKDDAIADVYRSKSIKGQLGLKYYTQGANNNYDLVFDANRSTTSYSLGLIIPIFDKGDLFNSLDIAKLNYKLAKEEYLNKKKELENLFRAKVREINLNYENLKISKKSFDLSEKIYNISKKRFENGLITSKEFIQNQIDYIGNKQDKINSEIDYILSVYEYKKLIGVSLF